MTDANTPEPTPVAGPPVPPAAAPAPAAPAPAAPAPTAAPGAYGVPAAAPTDAQAPTAYGVPATVVGQSKAARLGFIFSISQFIINFFSQNVLNGIVGTGNYGLLIGTFILFRVVVLGVIIAGLVFGLKGLRETKDGTLKGRGLAIAAIVLSSLGIVFWLISVLANVALLSGLV